MKVTHFVSTMFRNPSIHSSTPVQKGSDLAKILVCELVKLTLIILPQSTNPSPSSHKTNILV